MRNIEISEDTWTRLQRWAKPLEDTPDSVLVKVLNAAEGRRTPPAERERTPRPPVTSRAPKEPSVTPQAEFRRPLLTLLHELGGRARVPEIRLMMEQRMRLLPGDRGLLRSGPVRWWNSVCWVRTNLKDEGCLRSDSPRGIWELTERGSSQARDWLEEESGSFIDHLMAMPTVGEDADFDCPRSGPRRLDM